MKELVIFCALAVMVTADVSHILTSTAPPPPKPYAFGYAAGRYPGHIDRTHSEVSDGSGVVQGSYSYVDPKFQIRTVEYVADKDGFHPVLNHSPPPLPKDSAAVAAAKDRHLAQFEAIANAHQNPFPETAVPVESAAVQRAKNKHHKLYQKIAAEHARLAAETETAHQNEEYHDAHQ